MGNNKDGGEPYIDMEKIQQNLERIMQKEIAEYTEEERAQGEFVPMEEIDVPEEIDLPEEIEDGLESRIKKLDSGNMISTNAGTAKKQKNGDYIFVRKKKKAEKREAAKEKRRLKKEKRKEKKKRKAEKEKKSEVKERKNLKNKKSKQKSNRQSKTEEKKKSGFKQFLMIVLFLLILLGAGWYLAVSGIYGKMDYKPIESLAKEPMKDKGVVNILLIGNDSRSSEEEGRSDAMILLSVSQKTKAIHMTSLLRDMYVEIPGHDGNRLNASYAFGGPELLLTTVGQNLGIEVNRYVVVNFEAFANLVDAVGGIDLELSNEEVQWVNAYLNEYNMLRKMPMETDYLDSSLSGVIHLNGPQSLAYSRNRYIGSDFGRTERQRKVLSLVMKKLPGALIKNPSGLVNGLFTNLTTNLTKGECYQLSFSGGKLVTYDIIQGSIPIEGSYKDANIRGMAVLEVDFEQNMQYIRTEIYGEK